MGRIVLFFITILLISLFGCINTTDSSNGIYNIKLENNSEPTKENYIKQNLEIKDFRYDFIESYYLSKKEKSIKDRLLYILSPEMFEHLICNLLLLDNIDKNQIWMHIGGSGDGGIDCIGFNKDSKKVVGIAQCKLKKQSIKEMKDILFELNKKFEGKKFVCNYYCTAKLNESEYPEILNQERILQLLNKHKESNYWKLI